MEVIVHEYPGHKRVAEEHREPQVVQRRSVFVNDTQTEVLPREV